MVGIESIAEVVQIFSPYVEPGIIVTGGVAILGALTAAVVRMFKMGGG